VMSLALRAYFVWENKRRDSLYGSNIETSASEQAKNAEGEKTLDPTEREVPVL